MLGEPHEQAAHALDLQSTDQKKNTYLSANLIFEIAPQPGLLRPSK